MTLASSTLRAARALVATAALALCAGSALAKDVKVTLTGAEETPPVTTSAQGVGKISIAKDKSVKGTIRTERTADHHSDKKRRWHVDRTRRFQTYGRAIRQFQERQSLCERAQPRAQVRWDSRPTQTVRPESNLALTGNTTRSPPAESGQPGPAALERYRLEGFGSNCSSRASAQRSSKPCFFRRVRSTLREIPSRAAARTWF
jgi:hypothetical protein